MIWLLKFLKYSLFTIIILIVLGLAFIYAGHKYIFPIPFSATTTISDIKSEGFCLGVNCQPRTITASEFIPAFANQIKNYNQVAPSLWPQNHVVNLYAAVQSIESGSTWLISPNGDTRSLTKNELIALCPSRPKYNIGFAPFRNDSIQGVYLALSEDALKNVLEYQQYQYLGTYDLLLTYSHEMFHSYEQDKNWKTPQTIDNRSRNPGFDNPKARVERHLITKLLLNSAAAATQPERDSLILQSISNYQKYKNDYPNDYNAARYFDRIEGTAHYYEIMSSLYSAYPQQVNSKEKLIEAMRVLASGNNPKPYSEPGIITESYIIGAWTGFLLDEVQDNNNQWKTAIMEDPVLTPLDILSRQFQDFTLPSPIKASPEIENEVLSAIKKEKDKKVAPGIFRMLYQMIF